MPKGSSVNQGTRKGDPRSHVVNTHQRQTRQNINIWNPMPQKAHTASFKSATVRNVSNQLAMQHKAVERQQQFGKKSKPFKELE